MIKKEMIAMLLAGGQESRLGVLTSRMAKSALPFGGKYRIIDFVLSNCINSGVDTVGVLTQYHPFRLNSHIGIGIPWDLDRNFGGITILPSFDMDGGDGRYTGTAEAVRRNIEYMEAYQPDYVLILSGDHVYKMDYEAMLLFHKASRADVTVAAMSASSREAARLSRIAADQKHRIVEYGEAAEACGRLADLGIYIFNWSVLREALTAMDRRPASDFRRDVIPYCMGRGAFLRAYEFDGYWSGVDSLYSYWEANMGLAEIVPELNLYEEYWKIYTKSEFWQPQYLGEESRTSGSVIGEGAEICGEVFHSVIGCGVTVGKGAVVRDSVVMNGTRIGAGCELHRAIVAENVRIGENTRLGIGPEAENDVSPHIYSHGLVTVEEGSVIPGDVTVGPNAVICKETVFADYEGAVSGGGKSLIKAGE